MTGEDDDKVTRIHADRVPAIKLCSANARILYADDHVFLVRTTLSIGDQEWHDHVLHEFDADADPAA